jgi:hypothetical protein
MRTAFHSQGHPAATTTNRADVEDVPLEALTAVLSSTEAPEAAASLRQAPRPPPLIIPNIPQQQAAAGLAAAAPTASPLQPRSRTSVTPALLTMALADAGSAGAAAGGHRQATEVGQPMSSSQPLSQESEQLLSASGRPRRQRRRPSQPSSPTTGGAGGTPSGAASTPPALSSAGTLVAAGRQQVQVVCGSLTGWLDVTDLTVRVVVGQVSGVI